jgi:intein/homing endonuclease
MTPNQVKMSIISDQKAQLRHAMGMLIRSGDSLNKISGELGVAKSTIYYHYRKIRGRKYNSVVIPENDSIVGEFLGAFAGDGSFFLDKPTYHYTIRIHLSGKDDVEYAIYLKNLIEDNFGRKANIFYQKPTQLILNVYSKTIYELIEYHLEIREKTPNVCLKRGIDGYSEDFLRYFLRGLFDTDGCVQPKRIRLKTISKDLMTQSSMILHKFSISHNLACIKDVRPNCLDCYEITINKGLMRRFLLEIGLSNPRKLKILKSAAAGFRTPITTDQHPSQD